MTCVATPNGIYRQVPGRCRHLPVDIQQFLTLNRNFSAVWPVTNACGQVPANAAHGDSVNGSFSYPDLPEKVA